MLDRRGSVCVHVHCMCVLVFLSTTPVILLVSQGSHKFKDLHRCRKHGLVPPMFSDCYRSLETPFTMSLIYKSVTIKIGGLATCTCIPAPLLRYSRPGMQAIDRYSGKVNL